MKKIYVISYHSYLLKKHCVAANFFESRNRANIVAKQYEACGHTDVKILELLSE